MTLMVQAVVVGHRLATTSPARSAVAQAPWWTSVAQVVAAGAAMASAIVAATALLRTSSRAKRAINAQAQVATLDYWKSTFEQRMRLRRILPYEHTDEFKAAVKTIVEAYTASPSVVDIPVTYATRRARILDRALREYLSLFETLGAGVGASAFDPEVVWRLDGPRIQEFGTQIRPYLDMRRARSKYGDHLYTEFTTLLTALAEAKQKNDAAASNAS